MTYRFEHDPESGAIYIRVREGEVSRTVPLGDPGLGAAVDLDAEGNVLGVEFLSFEEFAELVESTGGTLELPERFGGGVLWGMTKEDAAEEIATRRLRRESGEAAPAAALADLTPREREVLQLLAEGMTNREIAARLAVSVATVRQHTHNVLETLGVESVDEAKTLLAR